MGCHSPEVLSGPGMCCVAFHTKAACVPDCLFHLTATHGKQHQHGTITGVQSVQKLARLQPYCATLSVYQYILQGSSPHLYFHSAPSCKARFRSSCSAVAAKLDLIACSAISFKLQPSSNILHVGAVISYKGNVGFVSHTASDH